MVDSVQLSLSWGSTVFVLPPANTIDSWIINIIAVRLLQQQRNSNNNNYRLELSVADIWWNGLNSNIAIATPQAHCHYRVVSDLLLFLLYCHCLAAHRKFIIYLDLHTSSNRLIRSDSQSSLSVRHRCGAGKCGCNNPSHSRNRFVSIFCSRGVPTELTNNNPNW